MLTMGKGMDSRVAVQDHLSRLVYGTSDDGCPRSLPAMSFRQRSRTHELENTREHDTFPTATPCIIPVFRPEQSASERVLILFRAKRQFRAICQEINAPGWGLPDLFRISVFNQKGLSWNQKGIWWGAIRTSWNIATDHAISFEKVIAAKADGTPAQTVENRISSIDADKMPVLSSEAIDEMLSEIDIEQVFEDARQMMEEKKANPESKLPDPMQSLWDNSHIEILHPAPFQMDSRGKQDLSLIVEALRRLTESLDLEFFLQGVGETCKGMIRLGKGRVSLSPVFWPLESAQTSCLLPLMHDSLAFLAGQPRLREADIASFGMQQGWFSKDGEAARGHLGSCYRQWLEENLGRLSVVLAAGPATRNQDGVWTASRAWASGLRGTLLDLISEDVKKGVAPESVSKWARYWNLRSRYAGWLNELGMDAHQPTPAGGVSPSVKAAIRQEIRALEAESGGEMFGDAMERGMQARILEAYADRTLERNTTVGTLECAMVNNSVALLVAVQVLQDLAPSVDLAALFEVDPACGKSMEARIRFQAEKNPGAGIPPTGKWKMLSKAPFFLVA